MSSNFQKFLKGKKNSSSEVTNYCSLLILASKEIGCEDRLKSFTFDKIRQELSERRVMKWGRSRQSN